jgi:hypothetical protein
VINTSKDITESHLVQENGSKIVNAPRKINLFTQVDGTNVALGIRDKEKRGLALLRYDPEQDFETQEIRAKQLLEQLRTGLQDPKFVLVGIPYFQSQENRLLNSLQVEVSGSPIYVELSTQAGQRKTYTKNVVLSPKDVRIVPKDQGGHWDYKDQTIKTYRSINSNQP